jgi:hypothetical protein
MSTIHESIVGLNNYFGVPEGRLKGRWMAAGEAVFEFLPARSDYINLLHNYRAQRNSMDYLQQDFTLLRQNYSTTLKELEVERNKPKIKCRKKLQPIVRKLLAL